ncbi:DUF3179 domain-containing protein [bacterium]|nr:DUF3179 domain-containing protein [bacterium]
MLRRTKIIIAAYCIAGLLFLGFALGLVLQFTDWLGNPERYKEFTHDHHHGGEAPGPETAPAKTYVAEGKTYMKVPLEEEDFDVTQSCVDLSQILQVNLDPKKFPDLEELQFVSAEESVGIPDEDAVVGVSIEGEEKAYPIRMLNYHVVLNDAYAGKEIAVVWDPLTMTPKVFGRKLVGSGASNPALIFRKLALLHKGGLLLCDQQTRSIWWPPEGKCFAGKLSGELLREYSFLLVSWKVWKDRHPGTTILSADTPFGHLYRRNWYDMYYAMPQLPVPVEGWDAQKSPFKWSEPVIAVEANGKAMAYPLSLLSKAQGAIEEVFGGRKIVFQYPPQSRPPYPTDDQGREIPYSFGAWFLWSARYPDIEVYSPDKETE